jgi:hypothetical protein
MVSDFFPLFGALGQVANRYAWRPTEGGWQGSEFPMYARIDERRQLFDYVLYGRSAPARVSWATLVGFVRGDVARLSVLTASGAVRQVAPTAAGGFSYAAPTAAELPSRVEAYDARGHLLGVERLDLKPDGQPMDGKGSR